MGMKKAPRWGLWCAWGTGDIAVYGLGTACRTVDMGRFPIPLFPSCPL